ncbi:hypothetical protein J4N42_10465 [Vibrio sp. SCSIO 43135]|uniref:hypothetical protein n=1 Tax=Vibrio sp. SCSIO 43135 TaxID=2819096 RepID=UPI002075BED0|nr:hypothetical protein [Vibrio sp. SCSIO 43135]USD40474.1 hypothetical protein J4N42_10465 [Vibrio sp. SCSIO 43135]
MRYSIAILSLLTILPTTVFASERCTVDTFQPVDIQPSITGGVYDKESGQFLTTTKPPMRCASVTFYTQVTRNRIARDMGHEFTATYFDGEEGASHSIKFDDDAVKAGYIRVGPNNPATAYLCFTTAETPIQSIRCDVK